MSYSSYEEEQVDQERYEGLKKMYLQKKERDDMKGYYVDKKKEPEKFYDLCDKNLLIDDAAIRESYEKLKENGVPEKYIFVVNANRDLDKKGDVFAYSNQDRLERALHSVRDGAQYCHSPSVTIFICVDVRDQETMGLYLSESYFSETWFKEMVASIQ